MRDSIYHITFPGTVTAHAACHVTYHRGAKMIHIFEIPEPNLLIHFSLIRCYDID